MRNSLASGCFVRVSHGRIWYLTSPISIFMHIIALAEVRDQGKTINQAKGLEIPRAVRNLRYFCGLVKHQPQLASTIDGVAFSREELIPLEGAVAIISPWNLPLYLLTWKIAPALLMGNVVIAKPSELTSLTAWMLCKLFVEAGLPAGVFNLVLGRGCTVGEALVRHDQVSAISFTGGTATGQRIQQAIAGTGKKVSLELGGKNASIVFADCDLDRCIEQSIASSFANQGEICLCTSRILVEETIFDSFFQKFTKAMLQMNIGDPNSAQSQMGALVSLEHLGKVTGYIELAKKEGCKVIQGTLSPTANAKGYYCPPTVITGAPSTSPLMQEEIFGPVVCLIPFKDEAEAIKIANGTIYGLAASVWTRDINRSQKVARRLQVGTVWINCWMVRDLAMPFGGMKASGSGREGGQYSLRFFSTAKTITTSLV